MGAPSRRCLACRAYLCIVFVSAECPLGVTWELGRLHPNPSPPLPLKRTQNATLRCPRSHFGSARRHPPAFRVRPPPSTRRSAEPRMSTLRGHEMRATHTTGTQIATSGASMSQTVSVCEAVRLSRRQSRIRLARMGQGMLSAQRTLSSERAAHHARGRQLAPLKGLGPLSAASAHPCWVLT